MKSQEHVLLVEDEQGDAFMFQFALQRAKLDLTLFVATDGQDAIDYLSGKPPYSNRGKYPLPSLVVLDLKLPQISGFEVLSWLADHSDLSHIPAVVLSSSSYDEDMRRASELGAREYFVKPSSTSELAKVIQTMADRWLNRNELPAGPPFSAERS